MRERKKDLYRVKKSQKCLEKVEMRKGERGGGDWKERVERKRKGRGQTDDRMNYLGVGAYSWKNADADGSRKILPISTRFWEKTDVDNGRNDLIGEERLRIIDRDT